MEERGRCWFLSPRRTLKTSPRIHFRAAARSSCDRGAAGHWSYHVHRQCTTTSMYNYRATTTLTTYNYGVVAYLKVQTGCKTGVMKLTVSHCITTEPRFQADERSDQTLPFLSPPINNACCSRLSPPSFTILEEAKEGSPLSPRSPVSVSIISPDGGYRVLSGVLATVALPDRDLRVTCSLKIALQVSENSSIGFVFSAGNI